MVMRGTKYENPLNGFAHRIRSEVFVDISSGWPRIGIASMSKRRKNEKDKPKEVEALTEK
jgi:hypothetical protein